MSVFFVGQCVMQLESLNTGVDDGLMKHGTSMALPISLLPWFSLTISCCCLSVSFQDHVCLLCWPMCHATREFDEEVDDDREHTLSCFIAILQQFTVDTFQWFEVWMSFVCNRRDNEQCRRRWCVGFLCLVCCRSGVQYNPLYHILLVVKRALVNLYFKVCAFWFEQGGDCYSCDSRIGICLNGCDLQVWIIMWTINLWECKLK